MKRNVKRFQNGRKDLQYIITPEVREELKPFVFFDAGIQQRDDEGMFIGLHPHSGIGILTYFGGANLNHIDTGGNKEIIKDGGFQWIRSGSGVWHEEHYVKKENAPQTWPLTIHQLWMQLPPELEESVVEYFNFQPEELPIVDNVKILVGSYNNVASPVQTPYEMTYLDINLKAGDSITIPTKTGQTKGFVFPRTGALSINGTRLPEKHISILEENEGEVYLTAESDSEFVIAMAKPSTHPIVTQYGSIHTNTEALERSLHKIQTTVK